MGETRAEYKPSKWIGEAFVASNGQVSTVSSSSGYERQGLKALSTVEAGSIWVLLKHYLHPSSL